MRQTESNELRKIVFYDSPERHAALLPLAFTRPVAEFRVGIDTIRNKWERLADAEFSYLPVEYLREKFQYTGNPDDSLYVAGSMLPNKEIAEAILALPHGEHLEVEGEIVAFRGSLADLEANEFGRSNHFEGKLRMLHHMFDVFLLNGEMLNEDFRAITKGRKSVPLDDTNKVIGNYRLDDGTPAIFIEEGASVDGASFNVKEGPIYIGKNATVMEGVLLRGPFALCENAKVNMGAKIYGNTTFGPYCKVGGEVNNVVMFGYSNKAHDGFLGNAVIGEWCNIGAGTNASNLKNDYSKIRIWNYNTRRFMRTELQFCGLIMGDHSKIGVNCMINTATVMGVGVNVYGSGFPRVFVPSFSEGSAGSGFTDVDMVKFFQIAQRVMARRGKELTEMDRRIFARVCEVASEFKK